MTGLMLRFLGTPEVRQAGRRLVLPTRKALALLAFVATEGGIHRREKLMTLLWPDSPSAQGRASLRTTLAYLRAALGETGSQIIADRESIQLDPAPDIDLDLQILDAANRLARQPSSGNPGDMRPLLRTAADLVRGEFLDGFSLNDAPEFDNWASVQREAWHRKATAIFDRLSQLEAEAGNAANATHVATRWVAHDQLNEAAHRRVMQSLYAARDRAAALRAYEVCCTMLANEFQMSPTPETVSLAEHIRSQAPSARQPVAVAGRRAHPEVPLVGRAPEHQRLVAAYHDAVSEKLQVVNIEGEPGIGKSRLAKEFVGWALAQGAQVLQGRAVENGGRVPFQVIVDALRSAGDGETLERDGRSESLSSVVQSSAATLSQVWIAELARILPELQDIFPGLPLPLPVTEGEAQTRLFEAISRLGQALARPAPLILYVDDLQWADPDSLDLLVYITRRWAATGICALIIFTTRSEELPAVNAWLTSLARDPGLTRLRLDPLTEQETIAMANAWRAGADWSLERDAEWLGTRLYQETAGNPLFILEALRSLREQGQVSDTSPGIRDVIQERLLRLSAAGHALYSAAAVLGDSFEFATLCSVTACHENEGLAALEELLQRGLLHELSQGARVGQGSAAAYRFVHAKIREVVYSGLSEARRQVFHRRALEALEASAPAAELARHALAAGMPERAFAYLVSAGDEALRVAAIRTAIAHYEQARTLHSGQNAGSNGQPLELPLGRAYELVGEWANAREVYEALLLRAREARQAGHESAALIRLATVTAQGFFDLPAAKSLLNEAAQLAEQSGHPLWLAEANWGLAQLGVYGGQDPASVIEHGERALALARDLGQHELTARSLNVLAYGWGVMGRGKEAEDNAQQAATLYSALDNRAMVADCLTLVALARLRSGNARQASVAAHEAYDISLAIENTWGQANSAKELGASLVECGEYGQALSILQVGVDTARANGHLWLLVPNLVNLGNAFRAVFDLSAARAAHLEAERLSDQLHHAYIAEWVATELCADSGVEGNWPAAFAYAQQALRNRDYARGYAGHTRWLETESLLRGGDVERAEDDLRRFDQQLQRLGAVPRLRLQYLRGMAVLDGWRGKIDLARAYLEEAVVIAEALSLPGELWQVWATLGEWHRTGGDFRKSSDAFARATDIVQRLASQLDGQLSASFLAGEQVRMVLDESLPG